MPLGIRTIFITAVLTVGFSQVMMNAQRWSVTFDEPIYIGSGAYVLKTGNFNVDSLWYNGPFSYYLNGALFPFLKVGDDFYKVPAETVQFGKGVGAKLLTRADLPEDRVLQFSRYPFALVFVILAGAIYFWAKRMYGDKAGWIALFLSACCPTLIAHASVATTDLTVTATFFLAVMIFWEWCREPTDLKAGGVGLCVALALLTKATALLLFPILFMLGIPALKLNPKKWRALGIFSVTLMVTIFLAYGCRIKPITSFAERPHTFMDAVASPGGFVHSVAYFLAEKIPVPAPEFWKMLFITPHRIDWLRPVYFMGETAKKHFWMYYPLALLIKSTLPMLILFFVAMILKERNRFLWIPMVVILFAGVMQQQTIGIRYILPIFPFMIVYASSSALWISNRTKWGNGLLGLLLLWNFWSCIRSAPNHLSYFNELIGGPSNGYKYLIDSDLDWGQNIKDLRNWMKVKGVTQIALAHQTMVEPKHYGFSYVPLGCSPVKGYVAASLTVLMASIHDQETPKPHCLDWLMNYKPVDRIGNSLWIYRIP